MFETYFKKLDIHPKNLSLDLVEDIQKAHLKSFSFNNIAVLLKREISLDTSDIVQKIVIDNLSGYCFEHNQLMHDILKYLGFNVRMLVAKVINNQDIDVPKTHRFTLLTWENEDYLVDVGFGSMCPNKPINIKNTNYASGKYRIIKNKDNDYLLELWTKKSYFSLYKFNLEKYTQADCIMANFYSANYPNAVFMNNFIISLILPDITLSLRNHAYHRISEDTTKIVEIKDYKHLHSIINNDFKITLSEEECNILFKKANV